MFRRGYINIQPIYGTTRPTISRKGPTNLEMQKKSQMKARRDLSGTVEILGKKYVQACVEISAVRSGPRETYR